MEWGKKFALRKTGGKIFPIRNLGENFSPPKIREEIFPQKWGKKTLVVIPIVMKKIAR